MDWHLAYVTPWHLLLFSKRNQKSFEKLSSDVLFQKSWPSYSKVSCCGQRTIHWSQQGLWICTSFILYSTKNPKIWKWINDLVIISLWVWYLFHAHSNATVANNMTHSSSKTKRTGQAVPLHVFGWAEEHMKLLQWHWVSVWVMISRERHCCWVFKCIILVLLGPSVM